MESLDGAARKAAEAVMDSLPLLVLTGAGISVESGIPPFRGPNGLWSRYDPDLYGHIDTFLREPETSWKMLDDIIRTSMDAVPNAAHASLARMEGKGRVGPVITQNVDGLHTLAGSKDVLELHGNARRVLCPSCGRVEALTAENYHSFARWCACGSYKRPDIVFFGEDLPKKALGRSVALAHSGRSMLVIGTSGVVQPAAMLPYLSRSSGGSIIEVNPFPSEYTGSISGHYIQAKATDGVLALERAFNDII